MRLQGRVVEWHDDRGYGFVVTHAAERRIFLHMKQVVRGHLRRPKVGDIVTYQVTLDERGRARALAVRFASQARRHAVRRSPTPRVGWVEVVLAGFGAVLGLAVWTGRLPWFVIPAVIGLSAVTFLFYMGDKRAAIRDDRRTPENTLHVLALCGGWPGAWMAQKHLRHKSSKASFRRLFWLTVAINVCVLLWLAPHVLARV
ncbi:MAG TPA: cold shock and DUF1294 domain-containing protein [Rhodanobacter sp.]|nr:cold shock and DUF1294 domain-containing protein [Rhodanobacter sp.]